MGYSKPVKPTNTVQNGLPGQKVFRNTKTDAFIKFPIPPRAKTQVTKSHPTNLNVFSWNHNTMGSKDALMHIEGSVHGHNPNVCCYQESRLTKEKLAKLELEGFFVFGNPAASTEPKTMEDRGLVTAVSKSLITEPTPKSAKIKFGMGVECYSINIKTKDGPITIHNIYVHQEADPKALNIKLPKGKHLLVGDFNARHIQWEPITRTAITNARGSKLFSLIEESANLVLCNSPHGPTTTENTTLTLSIVSAELAVSTDWRVLEDCVANPHLATMTTIWVNTNLPLPPFKPRPQYDKANWPLLNQVTTPSMTTESFLPDSDCSLETMYTDLASSVHSAIEKSVPFTKKHDRVPPCEQWWFGEKSKKAKQLLRKAVQANRLKLPGSRAKLRQTRVEALQTFYQEKHEKWNDICQSLNLSTSLGSHWKRLRWLYNGGSPPQPALMEYSKAKEMADEAMYSFSERSHPKNLRITTRLVLEELYKEQNEKIESAKNKFSSVCSSPFTIRELCKVLFPYKSSTPGEDGITYKILANLGDGHRNNFLQLVNKSFKLIRSPVNWKTVPIIPVPKKEKGEYRPIALLSCMGKVMEQMILNRLKHIVGPLHPNLMGCTQGKGTTDAIATFANIVSDVKHRRSGPATKPLNAAYAIFIDYMKAFELANSSVILSILCEEKGVVGNLLGWLQDFLSDRSGYTTILGQKSDVMPLHQGTPQGSVLSPFLFNILMDKLIRTIYSQLPVSARSKVTILSYADDIVLVCNNFAAKDLLGLALRTLEYASTFLGLQVNISKTKAMAWNHSQKFPSFQFQIYNGPIEWVRKFKYLGVTFDDTLSFTEHIEDVVSRVNSRINLLKHLAGCPYGATQKTLLSYYKTCIRPILEYGSIIICIACPTAINRLEAIQNTALKIALRLPRQARTQLILAESGCTSIEDRCKYLSATAFSKIKYPGSNHPYLQEGKEMHMDTEMLGKKPLHDSDIPLDMVLTKLSHQIGLAPLQSTPVTFPNPLLQTTLQKVSVDLSTLEMPKKLISLEDKIILRKEIETHISTTYTEHLEVYVDGSVDPITGRASAAFTSLEPNFEAGVRITDHVCSTQAELAAIHLTLEELLTTNISFSKIVIHCDSQAAIKTLQRSSPDPFDQMSTRIVESLSKLMSVAGFHLTIHWIPSHIGISGNEKADQICEKARSFEHITYHVPMSLGQVKSIARRYFVEKLKTQILSSTSETVLNYIKINPSLKPQGDLTSNPLVQLWINRLRLETEGYCYIHSTRQVCFFCRETFTAAHFLVECPVSANSSFRECLTEEEHSFHPSIQAQRILSKLINPRSLEIFSRCILKRPPKVACNNPQHGLIKYSGQHL